LGFEVRDELEEEYTESVFYKGTLLIRYASPPRITIGP